MLFAQQRLAEVVSLRARKTSFAAAAILWRRSCSRNNQRVFSRWFGLTARSMGARAAAFRTSEEAKAQDAPKSSESKVQEVPASSAIEVAHSVPVRRPERSVKVSSLTGLGRTTAAAWNDDSADPNTL
eukprot:TRINITY_DN85222_c0_g1_i1.p1 TRINITY_DN85222_c0_g1~~TRINITY_DN85222_c0_g1_i1.p1  ORF type:complete len:137 (+),score=24.17 TRINITY_DN85222_c0_g1_i1:29-412(+)